MKTKDFSLLFALEIRLHQNNVRRNENELKSLLSPAFFEFGTSGKIWDLNSTISALSKENEDSKIFADQFKAHILSLDIVLITYITKRVDVDGSTSKSLRSSIWKNIGEDKWQMLFHQGTKTDLPFGNEE